LAILAPGVDAANLLNFECHGVEADFLQILLKLSESFCEVFVAVSIAGVSWWACKTYCQANKNRQLSAMIMIAFLFGHYYLREEEDASKGLLAGYV
jgi:hypothetical protein